VGTRGPRRWASVVALCMLLAVLGFSGTTVSDDASTGSLAGQAGGVTSVLGDGSIARSVHTLLPAPSGLLADLPAAEPFLAERARHATTPPFISATSATDPSAHGGRAPPAAAS
jgi:hypothetical protein